MFRKCCTTLVEDTGGSHCFRNRYCHSISWVSRLIRRWPGPHGGSAITGYEGPAIWNGSSPDVGPTRTSSRMASTCVPTRIDRHLASRPRPTTTELRAVNKVRATGPWSEYGNPARRYCRVPDAPVLTATTHPAPNLDPAHLDSYQTTQRHGPITDYTSRSVGWNVGSTNRDHPTTWATTLIS